MHLWHQYLYTFFLEISRTLRWVGGVILIELHNGLLSAWLHKRLHKTEFFDPEMPGWEAPMAGVN